MSINELDGGAIRYLAALGATAATYYLGGWDQSLQVLVYLVLADYISGVLAAAKQKRLNSEVGGWGIAKKIMLFAVVGVAHQVDVATGTGEALRSLAIGFYVLNEALSCTENAAALGVPVPQGLLDMLQRIKGRTPPGGEAM